MSDYNLQSRGMAKLCLTSRATVLYLLSSVAALTAYVAEPGSALAACSTTPPGGSPDYILMLNQSNCTYSFGLTEEISGSYRSVLGIDQMTNAEITIESTAHLNNVLGGSGIYAGDENINLSITNYGTIEGGYFGITADSAISLTNYGTISGALFSAVLFNADGNSLYIKPGAVFSSGIDFHTTVGNQVNFGDGSYSVEVKGFDKNNNDVAVSAPSTQQLILNLDGSGDGTIEVVQETADASLPTAVTAYSGSVNTVISNILDIDVERPFAGDILPESAPDTSALGYAEEKKKADSAVAVTNFGNGVALDKYGNLIWLRAFGGQSFERGNATTSANYGIAAGVDHVFDFGRLGVLAGGGRMISQANNGSGRVIGDTSFGGVYYRKDFAGLTFDASFVAGGIHSRSTRVISGSADATGAFNGGFISPELGLSKKINLHDSWSLTSGAKVRYTGGFYQGYVEVGSTQNVSYGARQSHSLEGVISAKLTNVQNMANNLKTSVSVTGELVDTINLGSSALNASLSGNNFTVSTFTKRNIFGARIGLSGEVQLSRQATLYGGAKIGIHDDRSWSWSANAGVKVEF